MLCQNCGNNEANVRYTQIVNGVKKEMNLCSECAEKMGINSNFNMKMPLSFSDFLGDFFNEYEDTFALPSFVKEKTKAKCENCGLTYDDFLKTGLLGCPKCYEVFEDRLNPAIRNIQGNTKHVGRVPGRNVNNNIDNIKKEEPAKVEKTQKEKLEEELKQAIKEERYEDAAKLRDQIKTLDK